MGVGPKKLIARVDWELNGDAGARVLGLSPAEYRAGAPALDPIGDLVLRVWDFCDGWNPERIPAALAMFGGTGDVPLIVHLVMTLRERIRTFDALRRGEAMRR